MKTVDFGATIVVYNLIIGVLLMLASSRIAVFAGRFGEAAGRYTKVSVFAVGTCWAVLAATIYIAFHVLRLGL